METQININGKKVIFYRINIDNQNDFCMYEEKMVRYCLSAWVKDVDYSIKRLLKGQKVYTPVGHYVAIKV